MGFSASSSSSSSSLGLLHNSPWNFHSHSQRVFKILAFNPNFTHKSPITLQISNPNKALVRASSSKIESIQLDERSSSIEVARLLGSTSWSGAGPGLMDAATQGALEAGKPVGGFKIGKEAGEWVATNFHPYLPSATYLTCRFFSARKHGLVDAAVRSSNQEKTAVIVLPGGIGTLDEAFEILALIQLERIGSALPVPYILMNYNSFYSKLLEFLDVCEDWGTVSKGEVSSLWKVCNNNSEALRYLAEFYDLQK
ncbi:hypothetical protein OSB04_007968 [Centaurea solstitialis]|uniref:Cytokinin riboside 5'-monophosphate phosphoribohydrolase n=1 Tax=Centaurea solstitialis TaxID=347529 RepID=A0AA38U5D4_9ASTR|nr:hypothetical protein OSB04_007968 [Centaurea solstitialis]